MQPRNGMRKLHKELLRYVIMAVIFTMTWKLSVYAYGLESIGALSIQFAGIVASAWGATTLILKFMFDTEEQDDVETRLQQRKKLDEY